MHSETKERKKEEAEEQDTTPPSLGPHLVANEIYVESRPKYLLNALMSLLG